MSKATILRFFTPACLWAAAALLGAGFSPGQTPERAPGSGYGSQRLDMVKTQLRARGINDETVLTAMQVVPRHTFVPEPWREYAYTDSPLPIGYEQTISQPYIVAFMTEALQVQPSDKILEIGTGSGYQAAVLAELADSVYTIEIVEPLGTRARAVLDSLGYDNVRVKIGDGYQGWPEHAPFDAVIVTASPAEIPKPLQEQLREGGRMIIPMGESARQSLVLVEKVQGRMRRTEVLPVRFVPLVDPEGKPYD